MLDFFRQLFTAINAFDSFLIIGMLLISFILGYVLRSLFLNRAVSKTVQFDQNVNIASGDIAKLQQQNKSLNDNVVRLNNDLKNANDMIINYRNKESVDLGLASNISSQANNFSLLELEEKNKAIFKELEATRGLLIEKDNQLVNMKRNYELYDRNIQNHKNDFENLLANYNILKNNVKPHNDEVQNKLEEMKQHLNNSQNELEQLRKQNSSLMSDLNSKEILIADIKKNYLDLESEYKLQTSNSAQWSADKEKNIQDLNLLQKQNNEFRIIIDNLSRNKQQTDDELNRLKENFLKYSGIESKFKSKEAEWMDRDRQLNMEIQRLNGLLHNTINVTNQQINRNINVSAQHKLDDIHEGTIVDFKIIEGIGPKIEALLFSSSIDTYEKLANTSIDDLRKILSNANTNLSIHNPESWPEQARLLAERNIEGFHSLVGNLINNKYIRS